MAGRINNIYFVAVPFAICSSRSYCNSAFFFQLHGIHRGTNAILPFDIMNGMNPLGIEKNSFGQRRLTGIDM